MNSKIYRGETWHCRHRPVRHAFRYPLYFLSLDLGELTNLNQTLRFFGYNRKSPVSIWDKDYLKGEGTITEKVNQLFKEHQNQHPPAKVRLITVPKILGYVFNPVNFYLCYREDDSLCALIAEVNNTFGEAHIYFLTSTSSEAESKWHKFRFPKEFYVSPFFGVENDYQINFKEDERFEIQVNITSDGETIFSSSLRGVGKSISSRELILLLLCYPFSAWLTMTRIHWQAARLYLQRKVAFVSKPEMRERSFRRSISTIFIRFRERLIAYLTKPKTNER